MKSFIQILGWLGVLAILTAYFLVSFSFLSPHDILYPALNIVGSVFIIIETFSKKDYQPVVLNFVWLIIALVAILKII
jgi:hypothetical protein